MPMYNSIEYSDAYSKTSEILWQYYKDEPPLKYNGDIIDFPENNNNSNPFKFKQKITGQTGRDLLGTLGASLLGNILTIRAGKGTIKVSENFQCCIIL